MSTPPPVTRAGLLYGLGAYVMWGFFPLYWKQLHDVPALQILAHRMVWSLLFLSLLLLVRGQLRELLAALKQPRIAGLYFLAAFFLAINWGVYIWGVNAGFVVETSLGYFINPLLNVVLGALWLGERPRKLQWAAIGLAALGVLYLTVQYGQPPWIALTLASTFALYGFIKKKAPLGALQGLSLETLLLFVPALGFLIFAHASGEGALGQVTPLQDAMLLGAGLATAIPLLFFAAALRRLSLTTIGVLQYLAPTLQFLLGVFVYEEAFSPTRLVGFCLIWGGLILFTMEGLGVARKARRAQKASVSTPP